MFKHILFPTDGSRQSARTLAKAVRYAKSTRARITGLYVIPRFEPLYAAEVYNAPEIEAKMIDDAKRQAERILGGVRAAAKKAGVRCETMTVEASQPHRGIVRAARARRCDLIVMGSHGRKGLAAIFLGSESRNVLTNSRIPVLIFR